MHILGESSGYTLCRSIGEGAAGTVYEAIDRDGRRVALKRLRPDDPEAVYRFKREFRALAGVRHRNLVELYDLTIADGTCFFTMELVSGGNVFEHLAVASRPALDDAYLQRVRSTFSQLLDGLVALHERGLLHRDIKPSNVLVDPDGRVVLVDFGIVGELREGRTADLVAMVGTPKYMAPEQACGEVASPAADFYAMGVMLFEALTGRAPFESTGLAVLEEKLTSEAPRARTIRPEVPPELDDLCAALLCIDASERPPAEIVRRCLGMASASPRNAAAGSGSDVLFGRTEELEQLRAAFDDSDSDGATIAVVQGPSGSGMTALVQHFARGLVARGEADVLMGRCDERERVPFNAFDAIVDAMATRCAELPDADIERRLPLDSAVLARVFPVLRQIPAVAQLPASDEPDATLQAAALVAAMRDMLGRWCAESRLVLVIDDAQWSDDDSRDLLCDVLRGPDAPPVLVIMIDRRASAEASELVSRLRTAGLRWRELNVPPLPPAAAAALVHAITERPIDDAVLQAIVAAAGGSPFLLHALSRYVATRSAVTDDELSFTSVLRGRLRDLRADERTTLFAVALSAGPIDETLAAEVTGSNLDEVRSAFRALRDADLVRDRRERGRPCFDVTHLRVRTEVLADLGPEAIHGLHERFVDAITRRDDGNPEALLEHASAIGRLTLAASAAHRAARRAEAALAHRRAMQLFARGRALLSAEAASGETELFRALHLDGARCALRMGDAELATSLIDAAYRGAGSELARASVCRDAADILTSVDPRSAIARCLTGLRALGRAPLPWLSWFGALLTLARGWWVMRPRRVEAVPLQPEMTDPTTKLVLSLLDVLATAAVAASDIPLTLTAGGRKAVIAARHGYYPGAYASVAWLFVNMLNQHDLGYRLAKADADRCGSSTDSSALGSRFVFATMISLWSRPIGESIAMLRAIEDTVRGRDTHEYHSTAVMTASFRLLAGERLDGLIVELRRHEQALATANTAIWQGRELCWVLRHMAERLVGTADAADEAATTAWLGALPVKAALHWYQTYGAMVSVIFDDPASAVALTSAARRQGIAFACRGTIVIADHTFYEALASAGMAAPERGATVRERAAHLRRARRGLATLAGWASRVPRTFGHRAALVAAEIARVSGDEAMADEHYDRAIDGAYAHGVTHDEALAAEFAARHWMPRDPARGRALLEQARAAYARWGAQAKLRQLGRGSSFRQIALPTTVDLGPVERAEDEEVA